jgi:peptidoglycan/xylan/chitin deacetylase (PgdA/CDA1 family)
MLFFLKNRGVAAYPYIIGVALLSLFLTRAAANPRSQLYGKFVWHGPRDEKMVALTFDDGPNPPYTDQVLNILKEYGVRATFFVIGKKVEENPEVAERIVREGHIIGNHTYSHPNLVVHKVSRITWEIERAEEAIYKATGEHPYLFRPPVGFKRPAVLRAAKSKGYIVISWSQRCYDWKKRQTSEKIAQKHNVKMENGAIILLHDGGPGGTANRSATVQALPKIIEEGQRQGYRFVTVPQLLGLEKG